MCATLENIGFNIFLTTNRLITFHGANNEIVIFNAVRTCDIKYYVVSVSVCPSKIDAAAGQRLARLLSSEGYKYNSEKYDKRIFHIACVRRHATSRTC